MVAKKSASDKYVRVAFTMEPELHSSVIEKVKSEKATLSGVISSLLSGWVSGAFTQKGEMSPYNIESVSIQEIMSRIKTLEKSVSALVITDNYQYASVHISPKVIDDPELSDKEFSVDPVQSSNIHPEENTITHEQEIADDTPMVDDQITNKLQPVEDTLPESQNNSDIVAGFDLKPDEWYTQLQVRDKIDAKIPLNTRKGWVSKAVSKDKFVTNGKKGKECRIKGSSAIEWIKLKNQKSSESK